MKRDLGKILDTKVAASQMWHPGCRNLCPTIWHNFWPPFSFLKLVPLKIQFTIWSPDLLVKGGRGTSVRVHIWRLIWNRQCHCFQNKIQPPFKSWWCVEFFNRSLICSATDFLTLQYMDISDAVHKDIHSNQYCKLAVKFSHFGIQDWWVFLTHPNRGKFSQRICVSCFTNDDSCTSTFLIHYVCIQCIPVCCAR